MLRWPGFSFREEPQPSIPSPPPLPFGGGDRRLRGMLQWQYLYSRRLPPCALRITWSKRSCFCLLQQLRLLVDYLASCPSFSCLPRIPPITDLADCEWPRLLLSRALPPLLSSFTAFLHLAMLTSLSPRPAMCKYALTSTSAAHANRSAMAGWF